MSSVKNKLLLFYNNPANQLCQKFFQILDQYPGLKKQFIFICANDPRVNLPEIIRKINTYPVLIVTGINVPIVGEKTLSWLMNNSFATISESGMEFGNLNEQSCSQFAQLSVGDTEYNQYYNQDYNHGFNEQPSIINNFFSKTEDDHHVSVYDNDQEKKADLGKKVVDFKKQREKDKDYDHNQNLSYSPNTRNNDNFQQFKSLPRPDQNLFTTTLGVNTPPRLPFALPPRLPFTMSSSRPTNW